MNRPALGASMTKLALVVLAASVALGCEPPDRSPRFRGAGATTPRPGGTLRFAMKDAIRTLDPAIAYDEFSWVAVHPLHDTLVDYDAGTKLVPRLAERYAITEEGLAYRFTLRPNLRYSNGRPIVAADFATSLHRALTKPDSPFGSFLVDIDGAREVLDNQATTCRGIVVRGDRELEIRLARRNAAFLNVLAMAFTTPVPADHVAKHGDDLRRAPLASGPYELASWDEGQRVVMRRNAHYHDPSRQRIETVVLLENLPRETQFLMFERGELDSLDRLAMSAPDYLWITNEPAWAPHIHRRAGLNAFGSRMDVSHPQFRDRRVRQALNYAFDKRSTFKLLGGGAAMSHGLLPPDLFGRDEALEPYPYDPDKARALLAEAGFPNGFSIEYMTIADEEAEKLAQSLQSDLAKVGVDVSISLVSFPTYATAVGKRGAVPFSFAGWIGDYADPTGFFDPKLHSRAIGDENSSNDSRYVNAEVDQLLDAARAELDPDKRAAMYERVERIVFDDAPWIFDYHRMLVEITQPYVRDFEPHPIWGRDFTRAWLDLGPAGERLPR